MLGVKDWRATVDVDAGKGEEVLVFTPMQMVLESIPRTLLRTLSVS